MTPKFQLLVSGNDITEDVTDRAGIIEWSDTVEEGSDGLTITLHDADNLLAVPKSGAKVELAVGYGRDLQRVGSYTVESTQMEGPPDKLSVSCTSAPVAQAGSIAARRSRSWEFTTLGSIAETIAANLSSTLAIDPVVAATLITNAQQVDQSDTDFLLRLVRRHGGFLKFADGRLVISREGSGSGTGGTALTVDLMRSDVTSWKIAAGGKGQALKKVKVKYHKYETGETGEVEAEIKQSASAKGFAEDAEWLATSESAFVAPTTAASEDEAKAQASTAAGRIGRSSRQFDLSLPGRLDIVAGGKVSLSGFRDGVDGEWLVKDVKHRLDSSGWSMTVAGEGS
jgi:phage protein D